MAAGITASPPSARSNMSRRALSLQVQQPESASRYGERLPDSVFADPEDLDDVFFRKVQLVLQQETLALADREAMKQGQRQVLLL